MNIEKNFNKFLIKLNLSKKYNCNIFIETGTHTGKTVLLTMMTGRFSHIYSIEYNKQAVAGCVEYLGVINQIFNIIKTTKVAIVNGDSSIELKKILDEKIKEKCLIYLDAHYDGHHLQEIPITGYTPVLKELDAIQNHSIKNHVIVIDDIDSFVNNSKHYPSVKAVKKIISSINKNYEYNIKENMLICTIKD